MSICGALHQLSLPAQLLLGIAFVSLHLVTLSTSQQVVEMVQTRKTSNDDEGNFTNCGSNATNFAFRWSPRIIRPGVTLVMDLSWTNVALFKHGILCSTIWLQGVPDPVYKDCHDQVCEDVQKAIGKFAPFSCPLQPGYEVSFKKFTYPIAPTIPLPSGKFSGQFTLNNQDDVQLFCIKGDLEIIDE